jgi:hypothetical protein
MQRVKNFSVINKNWKCLLFLNTTWRCERSTRNNFYEWFFSCGTIVDKKDAFLVTCNCIGPFFIGEKFSVWYLKVQRLFAPFNNSLLYEIDSLQFAAVFFSLCNVLFCQPGRSRKCRSEWRQSNDFDTVRVFKGWNKLTVNLTNNVRIVFKYVPVSNFKRR